MVKLFSYPRYWGTEEEGNAEIRAGLISGKPFFVARFGVVESILAGVSVLPRDLWIGNRLFNRAKKNCYKGEVFWPQNDDKLRDMGHLFVDSFTEMDVYITWQTFFERRFTKDYALGSTRFADFKSLEPFRFSAPWSEALQGKRVLVISPFPRTVQHQYLRRELLWENPKVLPQFELSTMKSIYGRASAPDCATWFDALDKMYREAMEIDFDVALLACGPFVVPLGARFKAAGRSAITMCGVTQLLFGIKGHRWDVRPDTNRFYNEHWVRPDMEEMPDFCKTVEKGCYL